MHKLSSKGFAHLALLLVIVPALVIGAGAFVYMKQKGPNNNKLKADAAGAYSAICGSGYNLVNQGSGNGFTVYTYRNNGKGCALTVNQQWGTTAFLEISGPWDQPRNAGNFKYYAGPIYYSPSAYSTAYKVVCGNKNHNYKNVCVRM